ncbi:MAG TPA: lysozyme inhibitor LprI family protein [Allosphingosinicella sp.]|nr:lysozyme inhibitor LprI family protein [Allosphingosinicella sp.]
MRPFPLLAVALAIAAAAEPPWDWGDASDEWTNSAGFETSKALCRKLRDREPPASDRPDPAQAAALKGCDSEALYYGIGRPADPVRARQCAFLEAEREDAGVFSGRTMLMTIYANGRGAKRDLEVATHLACGLDGAPMESHGRVSHLAEAKAKGWSGQDFHFCDDITSGLAMGYCASHFAGIAGARRESELAQRIVGWTAAEKQAFARLRQAHEAYVEAHGLGEVDLSGTARGAMVVEAEEAERDEFSALLTSLSGGHRPPGGAAAYKAADSKLNAAYRQLMRDTMPTESPGPVTREGIRDAQRAWLRYRDAFLAFAAVKFPKVDRDGLAAWLTEQRTEILAPVE